MSGNFVRHASESPVGSPALRPQAKTSEDVGPIKDIESTYNALHLGIIGFEESACHYDGREDFPSIRIVIGA